MVKIACAVDEIGSLTPDEIKTILDRDKSGIDNITIMEGR